MKIWFKTIRGDKMPSHTVIEAVQNPSYDDFISLLREGCHALDLPTPTALASHLKRFNTFGIVRFYPDDFIESIDVDKLEIEILKEKRK